MKKLLSFVLSFSLIFGVCSNACYAVDSNNAVSENVISEEMQQYYYEDALSRAAGESQGIAAYSNSSANSTTTYFNGGLEVKENNLLRQTVIEIKAVQPGDHRIRYVSARDYWYHGGTYLATVKVIASFDIIQDVSVAEYNPPEFTSEVDPNLIGTLYIDEGKYTVTVTANKAKCTLTYKYRVDYDGFYNYDKIEITCDNQANVTGEKSDTKYWGLI